MSLSKKYIERGRIFITKENEIFTNFIIENEILSTGFLKEYFPERTKKIKVDVVLIIRK